jgi:hypothetical protein
MNGLPTEQRFRATLAPRGPRGAWVFLPIPFDVAAVFGTRSRLPVSGTMNGVPFRNSLLPQGDGSHAMAVSKELQAGAGAGAGDTVEVVLDVDRAERSVDVPEDFQQALGHNARAAAAFGALAPSHKRAYVDWISGAKKEETRAGRIRKAADMLTEGTRTPR